MLKSYVVVVLSLNVKQEVWDGSVYGGNLVKGMSCECYRMEGFEEKRWSRKKLVGGDFGREWFLFDLGLRKRVWLIRGQNFWGCKTWYKRGGNSVLFIGKASG